MADFFAFEEGNWIFIRLDGACPTREFYESHDTEEGWSSSATTYRLVDDGVEREWETDGRDCDGRLTRSGTNFCAFADLASVEVQDEAGALLPFKVPAWRTVLSRQRDYSAEAAGY